MYLREIPAEVGRVPIHRKVVVPAVGGGQRVAIEAKPRPFSRLADSDYVDTADVCRLFGCSARSVYRWVAEGLIRPAGKVGREFLFTKREIVRWFNERPHFGRPLGDGR